MIDWGNIVWVGLVGGGAMSLVLLAGEAAGLVEFSLSRYQGCMITGDVNGTATYLAGFIIHLVVSVIIAVVYAWAFASLGGQAGLRPGLTGGLIHWATAGLVLPLVDGVNRCVRGRALRPFGLYGSKRGAPTVTALLLANLVFGLLVGLLYSVPS